MVHSKRHFRKAPGFAGVAFFFDFAWVLGALTGYGLASGFHAEASPGRRPHPRRMVYCDCSGHGSILWWAVWAGLCWRRGRFFYFVIAVAAEGKTEKFRKPPL